jgi:soluble lytic murein transglycosylase-like protein
MSKFGPYVIPTAATPYLSLFHQAEREYNLPMNLLVRMAQQESYFNPQAVSPVGAEGIMQLMPQFYPGVNPFDPSQAIPAAAKSISSYYNRFGDWKKALAAYNWGPGNVQQHGMQNLPPETQKYVANIAGDLNLA